MPPESWVSQVGFGIVAVLTSWWAWHLWNQMQTDRKAHAEQLKTLELARETREKEHDAEMTAMVDKLLAWSETVRIALGQNTDALKGMRDGLGIYETLSEMRSTIRGQQKDSGSSAR